MLGLIQTGLADHIQASKPPSYITSHPGPTQPPSVDRKENEYWPSAVMFSCYGIKAGWLIYWWMCG